LYRTGYGRVTVDQFLQLVVLVLGAARQPNREQRACLAHDPASPLLVVAGPGSGKTMVLVLRALRHVLVDHVSPEQIVITTFTRKAAKEIRTRLIEWGTPLIEEALSGTRIPVTDDDRAFLRDVDINRFVTGTLDSICEEALSGAREPNERPPVVVETFAANQMLARRGEIFQTSRQLGQQTPQIVVAGGKLVHVNQDACGHRMAKLLPLPEPSIGLDLPFTQSPVIWIFATSVAAFKLFGKTVQFVVTAGPVIDRIINLPPPFD